MKSLTLAEWIEKLWIHRARIALANLGAPPYPPAPLKPIFRPELRAGGELRDEAVSASIEQQGVQFPTSDMLDIRPRETSRSQPPEVGIPAASPSLAKSLSPNGGAAF